MLLSEPRRGYTHATATDSTTWSRDAVAPDHPVIISVNLFVPEQLPNAGALHSQSFLQKFYNSAITFLLARRSINGTESGMELLREGVNSLPPYQDRHLSVDFREQLVLLDGKPLLLRKKEFNLFALLVQNAGQVVPRQSLLSLVWGYSGDVRTRTLDVHVRRLRSKLGCHADRYIETIFGIGYRFQPYSAADPVSPIPADDSPSYLALPA
jgi:DNA-binding winged helix-turn-helix (wHTH) protein